MMISMIVMISQTITVVFMMKSELTGMTVTATPILWKHSYN